MDSAPEFLNLFVEPTGELIYFLAVFAISQATLLMAFNQRLRGPSERAAGRYAILLTGIVVAWLVMGAGGMVALITDTPDNAILPPLERAVNAAVILLASAALLTADSPTPRREMWRALGGVLAGLTVCYAITAVIWHGQASDHAFNDSVLGYIWTFVPGLGLIFAASLLLTRYKQTADIPLKLIFFAVLLAGYSYTLVRMSAKELEGDTSGALRLAFLTGMPTVTIVVYRLVLERLTAAIDEVSEYAEAVSRPQLPVRAPEPPPRPSPMPMRSSRPSMAQAELMTLLKAIGLMLDKEEPDHIPRQIVMAMANVLKADVAVLVSQDENSWADVLAAFDNIQQRLIPGLALNLEEQPTLVGALRAKRSAPCIRIATWTSWSICILDSTSASWARPTSSRCCALGSLSPSRLSACPTPIANSTSLKQACWKDWLRWPRACCRSAGPPSASAWMPKTKRSRTSSKEPRPMPSTAKA